MSKKLKLLLLTLFVGTSINLKAQTTEVRGVVLDEENNPLSGVSVVVKGTATSTQTDAEGKFAIGAAEDSILEFSFSGMVSQEIPANQASSVSMKKEEKKPEAPKEDFTKEPEPVKTPEPKKEEETKKGDDLDDVVINTGVTERKKALSTGAVTIYSGTDLRQISTQNAIQALKTLDPSFIVINNNLSGSNPNSLPNVEVRGKTSLPLNLNQINAQFGQDPNQPLFILDGFPTTLQQVVDLDINRIASITLLKDVASTALYGSRSANGVVVIETVKPTASKLQVSYSNNSSVEIADLSAYNLMNAEQKLEFERLSGAYTTSSAVGGTVEDQLKLDKLYNERLESVRKGVNTYWLNEPIQTGVTTGHSLSLGGGTEEFRFSLIGNYKTLNGAMKGSKRDTWGYNTTLIYRKNKFNISNNLFINGGNNQESPYGSFSIYAKASPYYPKYNENGVATPYLDGTSSPVNFLNNPTNPLYNTKLSSFDKGNNFNFTNNFSINYEINKHIRTTAALSVTRENTYSTIFISPENTSFISEIYSKKGSYTRSERVGNKWNANIGGTYSNIFKAVHSFAYTIRASAQENQDGFYSSVLRGFPVGVPANPSFAFGFEENSRPNTYTQLNRSVDLINQMNYSYDRRYLLDLTYTVSGSTNFGANKKYSPYWGIGLGWNLHNELKMNPEVVNVLKLRGNIGQTGNQNLAGFNSFDVYSFNTNTNSFGAGLGFYQIGNPNLVAQKTNDLSLGLDLAMYRNRFTATLGVFNRKTNPQIVPISLAPSTGVEAYPLNLGFIISRGFELKLNYNIIYNLSQNIIWGVGLTSASNESRLGGFNNTLSSLNESAVGDTNLTRYYDGASVTDIWAVKSLGIDPATGREIFLKKNGEQTFVYDKRDEVVVGNSREVATGVVFTNVSYKNYSLGINLRYSFGADVFNEALYRKVENIDSKSIFDNQDERAFTDRWSYPGQVSKFKAISLTETTPISSRFVQKEDYLSGESIRLGYRVTNNKWLKSHGVSTIAINALANEFFRWSTIKSERGIDYPFSRVYSLSFNVSF